MVYYRMTTACVAVLKKNLLDGNNRSRRMCIPHVISRFNAYQLFAESLAVLESDANIGHRALIAVLLRGIVLREAALLTSCNVQSYRTCHYLFDNCFAERRVS